MNFKDILRDKIEQQKDLGPAQGSLSARSASFGSSASSASSAGPYAAPVSTASPLLPTDTDPLNLAFLLATHDTKTFLGRKTKIVYPSSQSSGPRRSGGSSGSAPRPSSFGPSGSFGPSDLSGSAARAGSSSSSERSDSGPAFSPSAPLTKRPPSTSKTPSELDPPSPPSHLDERAQKAWLWFWKRGAPLGHHLEAKSLQKEFRKLAIRLHPDKNPHPQAIELFLQLREHYETLNQRCA